MTACVTVLALCAVARGDGVEAGRDELIARIARGEADGGERGALCAALSRAHAREAREKARRARREAYRDSADRDVANHCGLSVDPRRPVISPRESPQRRAGDRSFALANELAFVSDGTSG
jgi:hypothetical protein